MLTFKCIRLLKSQILEEFTGLKLEFIWVSLDLNQSIASVIFWKQNNLDLN